MVKTRKHDMDEKVFWCSHCLNMSTRPRITFDERGWCNACQWMEEKQKIDWKPRQEELKRIDIDVDQEYRCQYTSARTSIFGVIKDEAIEDFEAEEYGNN